ncbi:inositol monophosphatase family protein [Micromonospora sp. NPDC005305]|uniref:inositol monophosphatase family protein n=1 Tax=Micromonospora sp. NPDC005305 TaxID=3156875 RepID=UPI0033B16D69
MNAPRLDRTTLEFAIELSERAGALAAERFFAADFALAIKPDGTEVTDADLAVETMIRGELAARFPADEIYGEETGATAGTSGRRWVIDPIDGTKYFAYRIPVFGTNLALEDEHGPALAVINQPVARQLIYAGRDCGCRLRIGGRDLRPVLRDNPNLAAARVELVNPAGWPADLLLTLHRHTRIAGHLGGIGGLLTGLVDAMVIAGPEMGYEDLAPLPLILEEAGGRATDLHGGPLLTGDGTALLSTGRHHDALLDLLAPVLTG